MIQETEMDRAFLEYYMSPDSPDVPASNLRKQDYIAGMKKAMQLLQDKADKWNAIVAEVQEQQSSEENMYPEDYGYILMNNLGIKDNN